MNSCPYGGVVVVPALLAWLAAIATLVSGLGCHMIEDDGDGYGPWTRESRYYANDQAIFACVPLEGPYFDAWEWTARVFSMTAMVLGVLLLIVISLPCCCTFGKRAFMFIGFVCMFTAFSSSMTLIMRGSCPSCEYGWTAIVAMGTGVTWSIIGLFLMVAMSGKAERNWPAPHAPPPAVNPAYEVYPAAITGVERVVLATKPEATEETIRKANPDGTVTVIQRTTAHNPDGSKTVTEASHVEHSILYADCC
jgi:hypothetical protein